LLTIFVEERRAKEEEAERAKINRSMPKVYDGSEAGARELQQQSVTFNTTTDNRNKKDRIHSADMASISRASKQQPQQSGMWSSFRLDALLLLLCMIECLKGGMNLHL